MNRYKRTSHAFYFICYHICWPVKYRRSVITKLIGQYIKQVIQEIADGYGWEIITHGMETDQVKRYIENQDITIKL